MLMSFIISVMVTVVTADPADDEDEENKDDDASNGVSDLEEKVFVMDMVRIKPLKAKGWGGVLYLSINIKASHQQIIKKK